MGIWEHFKQMPLGVKVVFLFSLTILGWHLSSTAKTIEEFQKTFAGLTGGPVLSQAWWLATIIESLFYIIQPYGLWAGKKFVRYAYPSIIIYFIILNLSTPPVQVMGLLISIVLYGTIFWYVQKKKDYFAN
jgi:hypothetical protein